MNRHSNFVLYCSSHIHVWIVTGRRQFSQKAWKIKNFASIADRTYTLWMMQHIFKSLRNK